MPNCAQSRDGALTMKGVNDSLECGHDFSPSNYRLQGAAHQCLACNQERREAKRAAMDARDFKIIAEHRAGATRDELAAKYGLSPIRIYVIVRDDMVRMNKFADDPTFPQRAMKLAADLSGSHVDELKSHWRDKHLVRARWAVMAAMHERGAGPKAIARRLCRDHSTVKYGLRQVGVFAERSPEFRAMLDQVRAA